MYGLICVSLIYSELLATAQQILYLRKLQLQWPRVSLQTQERSQVQMYCVAGIDYLRFYELNIA